MFFGPEGQGNAKPGNKTPSLRVTYTGKNTLGNHGLVIQNEHSIGWTDLRTKRSLLLNSFISVSLKSASWKVPNHKQQSALASALLPCLGCRAGSWAFLPGGDRPFKQAAHECSSATAGVLLQRKPQCRDERTGCSARKIFLKLRALSRAWRWQGMCRGCANAR